MRTLEQTETDSSSIAQAWHAACAGASGGGNDDCLRQ